MSEDCAYLFTYGTLRDSNINHKAFFLQEYGAFHCKAYIQAKLYKVTWYPAIRLLPSSEHIVYGDIYVLPLASREMVLHELDGYEGIYSTNEASEEYERVITKAYLEDDSTLDCYVYNYKNELAEELRIMSGDYLKYLKEQY